MKTNNLYYTVTNGDIFTHIFGLTPTEVWAMTEDEFLKWRNSPYGNIGIDIENKCKDITVLEVKNNGI